MEVHHHNIYICIFCADINGDNCREMVAYVQEMTDLWPVLEPDNNVIKLLVVCAPVLQAYILL